MEEEQVKKRKTRQQAFDWQDSQVEFLITAWSQEHVLYDSSHAEYHVKEKRRLAVERILAEFITHGDPPFPCYDDVLKKINNLRCYFVAEKNKIEHSKSSGKGTADVYKTKWQYYETLSFLSDNVTPRKNHSNLRKRSIDVEEQEDDSQPTNALENKMPAKTARKIEITRTNQILESALKFLNRPKSLSPHQVVEQHVSSDKLFGSMLGNMLEELPDGHGKDMLKLDIQRLVMQEKYKPQNQPALSPQIWVSSGQNNETERSKTTEVNSQGFRRYSSSPTEMAHSGNSANSFSSSRSETPLSFTELLNKY